MRYLISAVLVACMILAIGVSASAGIGTWKSYARDSTGSLTTTDSQSAYFLTKVGGVWQPEVKLTDLEWTLTANSGDLMSKSADFSSTEGSGASASWRINDNSGTQYDKMFVTPGSWDNSRGIAMWKMKVNASASGTNTTMGVSLGSAGVQLALRGGTNGAARIRGGEGQTLVSDPANFDQTVYRVYAISWVGGLGNVWYTYGTDWSSNMADWKHIGTNFALGSSPTLKQDGGAISGIAYMSGSSGNLQDVNIQWIAHNTLDNIAGEMNPWDFNPAPLPEPGGLLALATGLLGLAGCIARKRK